MADEALTNTIRKVHQMSRSTYGAPRVHAEFCLAAAVWGSKTSSPWCGGPFGSPKPLVALADAVTK